VLRRMHPLVLLFVAAALPAVPVRAVAQDTAAPPPPAADPVDVGSIDAIMAAVYEVISGPAGAQRDWDRMRSLFIPGARLIPTGPKEGGGFDHRVMSVEDYITRSGPWLEENGFFEREVGRTMDRYGNIVQVFSSYASRRQAEDPTPFMRGINSFQLWYDGTRWWVVSIMWEAERPDNPIPEKYLKSGR